MLKIECEICKKRFWVDGYITPDTWYEPGETVTNLEGVDDEICDCLKDGCDFSIIDESYHIFDDDVR